MLFQNVSILWCKNVTWSIYLKYWDTAWYLQKCNNFDKKEAASWCLIMWDFITVVVAFLWYTSIILQYSCLWEMFFTFNFPGTLAWKLALPRPYFLYKNLQQIYPHYLYFHISSPKSQIVCVICSYWGSSPLGSILGSLVVGYSQESSVMGSLLGRQ